MKKYIIIVVILLGVAFAFYKYFSQPSFFEIASTAELQGKYDSALENYLNALSEITEVKNYPDKSKAVTQTNEEWLQEVRGYQAWMNMTEPAGKNEYGMTIEGIKRCLPFIDSVNFITDEKTKTLVQDSLEKEWVEAFVRLDRDEEKEHKKLIARIMADSMSIIRIAAMTGYIYHGTLLDIKTGKRIDFTLYPNSEISLLVKPRDYFLIVSSEVQFTEGLKGKTWYSSANVIPLKAPATTSLYSMILRTKVRRTK